MKTAKLVSILTAVLALFVFSSCQMVEPEPVSSPAEQVELVEERLQLIGTNWEVESFGETDADVTVLPETKLTLSMVGERYAGFDGCNWFTGVYDSIAPQLNFYTPAKTTFICEDAAVVAQAATYSSALANIIAYEIEGEKLLTYTVGEQKMATFIPAQPVPLEGTEWTAKFVSDGEGMVQASTYEYTVSALFADGTVTGNAGCNDYQADYTLDGDSIRFTNIVSTDLECTDTPGADTVEQWYLAALANSTYYYPLVASLILTDENDQDLVFYGTP